MSRVLGTLKEVAVSDIQVDMTHRRAIDPDHLESLKLSIAKNGLISPICVYSPTTTPPYTLLAGAHRLAAIKNLRINRITVRIYDYDLSPYHLQAIELYENLNRKNLSPMESAQQTKKLHDTMVALNGPKITKGPGSTGHSVTDTAQLLGRSPSSVSKDIKLATAADSLPELQLAQSSSKLTALKTLQRLEEGLVMKTRMKALSSNPTSMMPAIVDSYRIGDFFSNDLTEGSYGFIECDPPYGVNITVAKERSDRSQLAGEYTEIPNKEYPEFITRLSNELYRLAMPDAWLILWHAIEQRHEWSAALESAGWFVIPIPAIWKKGTASGQTLQPDTYLGKTYESFIYARKGSASINVRGRSNIFDYQPVPDSQKIHPTERPVVLIEDIIRTFCITTTNILSPFLGSGATLIAAKNLGMPCVGYDLSKYHKERFIGRLLKGGVYK